MPKLKYITDANVEIPDDMIFLQTPDGNYKIVKKPDEESYELHIKHNGRIEIKQFNSDFKGLQNAFLKEYEKDRAQPGFIIGLTAYRIIYKYENYKPTTYYEDIQTACGRVFCKEVDDNTYLTIYNSGESTPVPHKEFLKLSNKTLNL